VELKVATTQAELDELFWGRYHVFVEEMKYYRSQSAKRLCDRYDDLPSTRQFIACIKDRLIGGIRAVEATRERTCVDDFYDFRSRLPATCASPLVAGMLYVLPGYRCMGRTALRLLGALIKYAHWRGSSHVVAAVSPDAEAIAHRVGFEFVSERFYHGDKQLWVAPMVLDVAAWAKACEVSRAVGSRRSRPISDASLLLRVSNG
jgi:N-acyl-L-homoserine lactone synthetase